MVFNKKSKKIECIDYLFLICEKKESKLIDSFSEKTN